MKGLFCEIFVPILIVIVGLALMTMKWITNDELAIISPQGLYGDK